MDGQSSPSTPTSIVIKWETAMPGPCVVTGADASQQDLLPFWLECLRRWNPQVPVVFADFGLTEEARSWCQHRGIVRSIPKIPNRKSWFSKPLEIWRPAMSRLSGSMPTWRFRPTSRHFGANCSRHPDLAQRTTAVHQGKTRRALSTLAWSWPAMASTLFRPGQKPA